jgi:hypothetical protein
MIKAADAKDCKLPSPPSIFIDGVWTNICPRCRVACTPPPYACKACRWEAVLDDKGCCTQVAIPSKTEVDEAKATPAAERTERQKVLASDEFVLSVDAK